MIANVNRDPKKNRNPFKPQDFMPQIPKKKKQLTDDEMKTQLQVATIAFGGKVEE